MYLFFDTETNGLPKDYDAPASDTDNRPRMVQLAWVLTTNEGDIISECCNIVQPDERNIPKKAADLHGITDEIAYNGTPIGILLKEFNIVVNRCNILVAHNINFDKKVLAAELLRLEMDEEAEEFFMTPQICTMLNTVEVCKIETEYGHKRPKLEELHQHLFNEGIQGAHNALVDVRATVRCFFELKALGTNGFTVK